MSENKKGPGSSLANSQGTNKSSNKLYHERNEEKQDEYQYSCERAEK